MKHCKILTAALLALTSYGTVSFATAQWSFLTYIQADNNLAPFATYNFKDMQKVGSTSDVNVLVQWDKPQDKISYRYKVLQNNMVINSSINQEMGYNPAKELVDSMKWVQRNYPAQRYGLVLWNHGNGVLDRGGAFPLLPKTWLQLPGLKQRYQRERGILYDYSQNTFLDNSGLSSACAQIKSVIQQNIDFLGMDACLMAMLEVAYQVKDSVNYLVTSQDLEPGYGWSYAGILSVLAGVPQISAADLGVATVHAYADFYSSGNNADSSITLSTIDVSKVTAATTAFSVVLSAIQEMQLINKAITKSAFNSARTNTSEFYISDYVDLIDLYNKLKTEFSKAAIRSKTNKKIRRRKQLVKAASSVVDAIEKAKTAALATIVASQTGSDFNGKANGISLYFPANGKVASSYKTTLFAQQTSWVGVLNSLQS